MARRKTTIPKTEVHNVYPGLLGVTIIKLDELTPDERGLNEHTLDGLEQIKRGLVEYGQRTPLVVNTAQNNLIEKGNGTYQAMRELGWTVCAVVEAEDDLITGTGYAIADNRSSELSQLDLAAINRALAEGQMPVDRFEGVFDETLLQELMSEARQEVSLVNDPASEALGRGGVFGDGEGGDYFENAYPIPDIDEEAGAGSRQRPNRTFPVPIVLSAAEMKQWAQIKESLGTSNDTEAFVRLLATQIGGRDG